MTPMSASRIRGVPDPVRERPQQANPSRYGPGASVWRRLVLNAFLKMPAGCLELEFPGGDRCRYGTATTPTATLRVNRERFFRRCVLFGDIGFGESYVDGDWDSPNPAEVVAWFIDNVNQAPSMSGSRARASCLNLLAPWNRLLHRRRPNSLVNSPSNIRNHYDLGNDFYSLWLDPTLTYSSARFRSPGMTLEEAQCEKYDSLCRMLRIEPSDHVLEIGSGWGGFAIHAVRRHGCRITTLTLSPAQAALARRRFTQAGVADRAEVRLEDYRSVRGRFDKIASIEMLEAVGDAYLDTYFRRCHALLRPNGILGLQFIACPDRRYAALRRSVDWIQKHIFPGSLLPSIGRVHQALARTGDLSLFHLEEFGACYARTLRRWRDRFESRWPEIEALGFDACFRRKWRYYLAYCEAAFDRRNITVVQAGFTRPNNPSLAAAPGGFNPVSHSR